MNVGRNKAFVFNEMPHSRSQQNMTPEHIASMKKKIISIRATKRILAPYVKARRKPKEAPVENVHFSFYIQKKPSILMKVMTKWSLAADLLAVMTETVQVLGEITKSTSATVYMVDDSMGEIYQVIESYDDTTTRMSSRSISEKPRISYKIETGTTVAAHVAYTKEIIKLDDLLEDIRFPGGLGNNEVTVKSVLCVPVLSPDSECLAVFELYRDMDHDVYSDGDLNIVILMGTWIGSTIYHNQQLVTLRKQHELTGYLLQLTECYFDDAKLLDKLISEIVNFAKIALDAENAMFYVLKECSADEHEIFVDEYSDKPYTEALCKTKNVEIIGTSRSKADLVNLISDNHNIVNIKHSTNDYRLKREQKRTKYKIRCLIATAIKCSDQVLGVMELFNKKDGPFFTKSDEILLKTFSDYCGLVLKFAHEYEKSRKVEKLNETYESMLNKNMVGCIHDSLFVISQPNIPFIPDKFNQFDFYLPEELDMYVPQLIMYMFEKLNPQMFKDKTSMAEFVLGIKKAYSDLPYHNFEHGFHVCHCMYNILSRCSLFDPIETTALILAAYCHGIDHRGVTNSFLKITDHPLANLYESNYLENHYFFVAKIIIEHWDVFSHLPSDDYVSLMSRIKFNLLSTTFASCIKSVKALTQSYKKSDFNLFKAENRTLLQSVIMCMSLFSELCKPFNITKATVHNMYEEYYSLGDKVRSMGFSPMPLFDKQNQENMAQDQINLMTGLILPCAHTMSKFVPTCEVMYRNALKVRDAWEETWLTQGQKLWSFDDSMPKTKKY